MLVSDQCVMKFKIRYYSNDVLCHIMPMDCCHILLGRPWQYDKHVVYDGRLNQDIIWTNEVQDILMPLIESQDENNFTTMRICMVSGKQFEKKMKKNQVHFSIIPTGPSCGSNG